MKSSYKFYFKNKIDTVDLKANFNLTINIQTFITNLEADFQQENKDGICNYKRWRRHFL